MLHIFYEYDIKRWDQLLYIRKIKKSEILTQPERKMFNITNTTWYSSIFQKGLHTPSDDSTLFTRFGWCLDKLMAVVISTAVSSSSTSSTLIFGDTGHSISRLDGDNAVEAREWGDTESLPDEYPQSEDDDNVLVGGLPEKWDDALEEEEW